MRGCLLVIGVIGTFAALVVFIVDRFGGFDGATVPSEQEAANTWLGVLFLIALLALIVWIVTRLHR